MVLDVRKLLMYDFHYTMMKPMYGANLKLLFTDTDSLSYEIRMKDAFADFESIKDQLDTSDYPQDHLLYSQHNIKGIWKMKEECFDSPPHHFVGLRSKTYLLLMADNVNKATAKSVKRAYAKKHL